MHYAVATRRELLLTQVLNRSPTAKCLLSTPGVTFRPEVICSFLTVYFNCSLAVVLYAEAGIIITMAYTLINAHTYTG